jgi:hypothetical protein
LSDSYSEDVPPIEIRDLNDADNGMHRAIGSQLIYNHTSGWSFFAGAISTDRFLTILRLRIEHDARVPRIASYEVDSTGTTEITEGSSLQESPVEDRIPLLLAVKPGDNLQSERLVFGVGRDHHHQLETYGRLIRQIYHARVNAPAVMGWWSWTAYYYGLTEGAALTNAQWLAEHLKPLGFNFFHLDEGYQYARGEYTTPDGKLFPHGVAALEGKVRALGLTPGIWTAPFEVSERSSIYKRHPNWLVHNAGGKLIHLGWANEHHDRLYVLDTTNPGAQEFLRNTYESLVKKWGMRYIKLDFMDDSSVEGYRYRPNTTAMQAQRIGLEIIRKAVGEDVLLDKDGSAMLTPVGFVDYGRIAQDTGHTFTATKEAAPALAARYYMNRNFFVDDPDAFTVSTQTIPDHKWNGGKIPLTLDEAKVSIALSAVSGGMLEIGDDLPTLGKSSERLDLVINTDLIDMVKVSKASTPVDLMTFDQHDEQPSIFFLREDARQGILTVFNWTDQPRSHAITLASLGLDADARCSVSDVFEHSQKPETGKGAINISQPRHSVRMLKIVDPAIPAKLPSVELDYSHEVATGAPASFSAQADPSGTPVLQFQWDLEDGVVLNGARVIHAFTQPGTYTVKLESTGLDGLVREDSFQIEARGTIPSVFVPGAKMRFAEK